MAREATFDVRLRRQSGRHKLQSPRQLLTQSGHSASKAACHLSNRSKLLSYSFAESPFQIQSKKGNWNPSLSFLERVC